MHESDIEIAQKVFSVGFWQENYYVNAVVRESSVSVPLRSAGYVVARYFEQQPVSVLASPLRGVELRLFDASVDEEVWDSTRYDARVIGCDGGIGTVSRRVYMFDMDDTLKMPQLHDSENMPAYRRLFRMHYINQMTMLGILYKCQTVISG